MKGFALRSVPFPSLSRIRCRQLLAGEELNVDAELENLQRESFNDFLHETNPANGLVIDKTAADWPASIAATGFALTAYPAVSSAD